MWVEGGDSDSKGLARPRPALQCCLTLWHNQPAVSWAGRGAAGCPGSSVVQEGPGQQARLGSGERPARFQLPT